MASDLASAAGGEGGPALETARRGRREFRRRADQRAGDENLARVLVREHAQAATAAAAIREYAPLELEPVRRFFQSAAASGGTARGERPRGADRRLVAARC